MNTIKYNQQRIALYPEIDYESTFEEIMEQIGARRTEERKYSLQKMFRKIQIFQGNPQEGDNYIYVQGSRGTKRLARKIYSLMKSK